MKTIISRRIHECFIFFCLLHFESNLCKLVKAQKCSSIDKMQNLTADYILGGFVPAHQYDGSAYNVVYRSIVWSSAILYAIKKINEDKRLLPGIVLGYDIRDSCQLKPLAIRHTLDYLLDASFLKPAIDTSKYVDSSCINRGNSHNTVFGVVGAYSSPISTVINNLLGVDFIPQISYGSTSASLSDPSHRSFIRTVPSDIHQADAIVDLLKRFDWTYVSAFVADDEYGRVGLDETRKNIKRNKLCLAGEIVFNVNITRRDMARIIAHLRRVEVKSHVAIIWSSVTNAKKIMFESQRHNITGVTWIGPEAWGTHTDLKSSKISLKENIIGIEIPEQPIPEFTKMFKDSVGLNCANPWFAEFLSKNQKYFPMCNLTCTDKVSSCQKMFIPILATTFQLKDIKIDKVLSSVYALAHGLHKSLNCTNTSCTHTNQPINYFSIYQNIISSEFYLPGGNRPVKFDKTGEILDISYNFKFYNPRRKRKVFEHFGSWKSTGFLDINEAKIDWGKQKKPIAHCSSACMAGSYRVNGSSSCCWSCAPCVGNAITTGVNEYECKNCSLIQVSNPDHTACIDLRRINMRLFDNNTIIQMSLAIFGILCTLFVLGVFVKYWDTPIVKSSSREMSCIQLVSIMLLFAFPGLYFTYDSRRICMIQVLLFAVLHCTILSLILVKTYRLLLVFRERFTSVSRFLHNKYQIAFSYIFVLVIAIAVVIWFVYFPTKIQYHINRDKSTFYTTCGDEIIWFAALFYLLILELVITMMAFRARKLPENFNEVQFIVFTMFTDFMVWLLVLLALYVSLDRLTFAGAFLYVNFASNVCRLVILYGYRVRIILFFPELNSPEHFRRTATGTTVTNFVKEVKRGDGTYKRSVTSVVQLSETFDSVHQPIAMRYSYSSIKQNIVDDQGTEMIPLRSNDSYTSLRLKEPTSIQPKTSPVLEIKEPFSISADNSTSSLQALTPDLVKGPFDYIKKWASTQFLPFKDRCSNDDCNMLALCQTDRAASLDCLDRSCRDIIIDKDELKALLKLPETSM